MPLDKATLKNEIKEIFEYEATQETHPEDSRERIATKLSDAIEKFVKSGDGRYQGGLQAGANPVTAPVPTAAVIKIV